MRVITNRNKWRCFRSHYSTSSWRISRVRETQWSLSIFEISFNDYYCSYGFMKHFLIFVCHATGSQHQRYQRCIEQSMFCLDLDDVIDNAKLSVRSNLRLIDYWQLNRILFLAWIKGQLMFEMAISSIQMLIWKGFYLIVENISRVRENTPTFDKSLMQRGYLWV